MLRRLLPLALLIVLSSSALPADEFQADLARWRAERVARLTAPDGWLSLVGLHWLERGDNSVGTAEDNTIRLAAGPAYLGTVHLAEDGRVTFIAAAGSLASSDGVPVPGSRYGAIELAYGNGQPTLVTAHNISFLVIQRGEKIGLRVRDTESDRRRNFVGLDYFPADPTWRIEARWEAFAQPRMIPITNMLGQTTPSPVPGKAVFTRDGQTFELLPISEGGDGRLFFILSDATSGEETYPAARFLYAAPPQDGKVVLDFNRAQNPPCAFTPFATCPLPPKENRMPIRVAAGEKNYRGEAH
jgi:uncharacterized protein (DUF1684 family)